MLHLLNTSKKGELTEAELIDMGVDCYPDTIQFLEVNGLVKRSKSGVYKLNPIVLKMLNTFLVARGPTGTKEVYVDFPSCFVVMPFSQPWSDGVYEQIIKAALTDSQIQCVRGDIIPRVGKLADNVAVQLQRAGLVIAEISDPNPNVYYELGVADTLGKDVYLLYDKSASLNLPADIQGVHYYSYDRSNPTQSREFLAKELEKWKQENKVDNVPKYCRM